MKELGLKTSKTALAQRRKSEKCIFFVIDVLYTVFVRALGDTGYLQKAVSKFKLRGSCL